MPNNNFYKFYPFCLYVFEPRANYYSFLKRSFMLKLEIVISHYQIDN